MLTRAFFLILAAGVAAPVILAGPSRPLRRPNIVFVLADQWRASATGYAGDPNVKTPALDRLARAGINFENAVSVCPVCTPYRAALLTGRYPTTTGMFMNDLYLPAEEYCMAEIFKEAGYATGYIGKWHLDGHGRSAFVEPGRRQGFEYWKAAECDHNYNRSHYYEGASPQRRFWPGYDAFAQTRAAQKYILDQAAAGRPFLLMISYGTPHFPHHTAPKEYRELYPPATIILRPNVPEHMRERARKEASGYYAHCTALDRCIGDVLASIEEAGIAGDTIFVFTSDHGEMLGSQGQPPSQKQRPWDESIRVPFLLRYPAVHGRRGYTVSTPINTPDILPTLLSLAAIPIPKTVEGRDMAAHVRQRRADRDRAALVMAVSPFADYREGKEFRGIRTTRYTYVRSLEGPWLLYDNAGDPYQQKNLVTGAEHAELRKALEKRLQNELAKIGDVFRPRQHYLDRWRYQVDGRGCIPYTGTIRVQSPAQALRPKGVEK